MKPTGMAVIGCPSIERRRFLELGVAASLSALLPSAGPLRAPRRLGSGGIEPHTVIYDERFEAAHRFGAAVRRRGGSAEPIRGDVTQLWYSRLVPLWKRSPVPIAGLTAYAAMFCLERLAWDHQLRMIHLEADDAAASLAAVRDGAASSSRAAALGGPLHLWLIAQPAQLGALSARRIGA